MNYRARDTTQSDFGMSYTALCQQVNEVSRVMAESNMNASNSFSEIEAQLNQCCCNLEQAKTTLNIGMQNIGMRIEEQTVEHYVPGFNSPFVTKQSVMDIYEDEQKSCTNCKWNLCYPTYKWCGADLEDPIRSCIRSGRKYWRKSKLLDDQDREQSVHNTVSDITYRTNQLRYERLKAELNDVHINPVKPDKPKKKYTIYDLYDLTFPDDPIKKHFITVCNNIEKRYQEKKKVLDQIEAPEVEIYHVDPVQQQMVKTKISQEALQTWVEFEKYVFIAFAAVYMFYVFAGIMLAFPVSIENGTRFLVDVTKICSSLFLATSSVSLAVAVFASRRKENDGGDNND